MPSFLCVGRVAGVCGGFFCLENRGELSNFGGVMGKEPKKLSNGMYLSPPGNIMHLGDYGYFSDGQWCKLGNIRELLADTNYFTVLPEDLNENFTESEHVAGEGKAGAEVSASDLVAGVSLTFLKKNSSLFVGTLKKVESYSSINREIEPALKQLCEQGEWEDGYMLVYKVFYSDNFFVSYARNAGCSVKLSGNIGLEALTNDKASVSTFINNSSGSLTTHYSLGDEMRPVGASLLGYDKKILNFLKRKISFKGADEGELVVEME